MADDISEKPDFESLLHTDFRWPTEGDAPFTQSENWEQNAYIDRFGHGRIVMMMNGYKMAGDLMVAQVARDRHDGDVLVFPVVFNYRQFIELSLIPDVVCEETSQETCEVHGCRLRAAAGKGGFAAPGGRAGQQRHADRRRLASRPAPRIDRNEVREGLEHGRLRIGSHSDDRAVQA